MGDAFPLGVVANGALYSGLSGLILIMSIVATDWLLEEAEMNVNWIHIDAQYSLSAVIPITEEKKSLRLVLFGPFLRLGDTPVDSDIGMSLLVGKI